ncbi:uncharacterized protein EKO05_0007557 [Ascochyta rabiei]|uniref:Uncharacterized protein n=1 Tax=Didymella rabiei TaxID=5454 RepID=A0A163GWF5_DIDRA|nr:uncharacterized protein EKO05_0007557 [Ascochyta rabiei]KZM25043.1 hypothetical protein ST47_g3791 [Ascochyta rabiei]UPX17186.1 hypothetical protein EKO05_0007557 [Ascochyta rabiei]
MKLPTLLTSAFVAAAMAAPTISPGSTVATEARWDYGSSNDKRNPVKTAAEWDFGSTGNERDVVDTDWDHGKKKGEMLSPPLAVALLIWSAL